MRKQNDFRRQIAPCGGNIWCTHGVSLKPVNSRSKSRTNRRCQDSIRRGERQLPFGCVHCFRLSLLRLQLSVELGNPTLVEA